MSHTVHIGLIILVTCLSEPGGNAPNFECQIAIDLIAQCSTIVIIIVDCVHSLHCLFEPIHDDDDDNDDDD